MDVVAFGVKLLQELSQLVEAAAAAQQPDVEGLCHLCEREMPLTKHHLIPRWGQALQLQLQQLCGRSSTASRSCGLLMHCHRHMSFDNSSSSQHRSGNRHVVCDEGTAIAIGDII